MLGNCGRDWRKGGLFLAAVLVSMEDIHLATTSGCFFNNCLLYQLLLKEKAAPSLEEMLASEWSRLQPDR